MLLKGCLDSPFLLFRPWEVTRISLLFFQRFVDLFHISELQGRHACMFFEKTGKKRRIWIVQFFRDLHDAHI